MRRLDHPAVQAWLARLDTEAAVLPEDRRAELRADVEDILAGATTDSADDDAAIARAVAELGDPADVVAEAGGYAVPALQVEGGTDSSVTDDTGSPWLETWTVGLLVASVVLALVPAADAVAPLPWFLGTLMVLLSRRWSAGAKGLAVLVFGVLGVPLLLLGRDELPTGASLFVAVLLVALWVGTAGWLLLRAHRPREEGRGLRMR
ncbi:MAG TPA: hypothetical protein VLQ78_09365 [Ornithinibacter sp.]|nr:hypothetical protein [Ornithinibacter sp.]